MPRLIDADVLVKTLNEVLDEDPSLSKVLLVRFAEQILNDAPTVDAEPVKKGHWIEKDDECECPFCGKTWNYTDNCTETFDYCPNCGAKMDEVTK